MSEKVPYALQVPAVRRCCLDSITEAYEKLDHLPDGFNFLVASSTEGELDVEALRQELLERINDDMSISRLHRFKSLDGVKPSTHFPLAHRDAFAERGLSTVLYNKQFDTYIVHVAVARVHGQVQFAFEGSLFRRTVNPVLMNLI